MNIVRPPRMLRSLYRDALWRMDKNKADIYLTFDDGPIPGLTPWILDVLKDFGVKATFFCVGDNIQKHPAIFERTLAEGHQVGNHTYNHIKGWETDTAIYIQNTELCQQYTQTRLFRPPYGRIRQTQYRTLKERYTMVFWDVLSYDYDRLTGPEACLQNVIKYTRNGSIVVFHDNLKAEQNLKFALPRYLDHCLKLNHTFTRL